jgi:hypothetical protein
MFDTDLMMWNLDTIYKLLLCMALHYQDVFTKFSLTFPPQGTFYKSKGKAIPVTGHEGP